MLQARRWCTEVKLPTAMSYICRRASIEKTTNLGDPLLQNIVLTDDEARIGHGALQNGFRKCLLLLLLRTKRSAVAAGRVQEAKKMTTI